MKKPNFINNTDAEIRKSYNPNEEETKILHHVYQRFGNMKDGRNRYDKDWDKWEAQWESSRVEKKTGDWKSNIVPPLSTSIIETIG